MGSKALMDEQESFKLLKRDRYPTGLPKRIKQEFLGSIPGPLGYPSGRLTVNCLPMFRYEWTISIKVMLLTFNQRNTGRYRDGLPKVHCCLRVKER